MGVVGGRKAPPGVATELDDMKTQESAASMEEGAVGAVRGGFEAADTNGDGVIDAQELFAAADTNKDGVIDAQEFAAMKKSAPSPSSWSFTHMAMERPRQPR